MDFTNIFYTANIFFIGMSSDNETVDVASSDETESDNDNEGEDERKDDEMIISPNAIQNFHLSEDLPMNNSLRQGPTVQNNE